MKILNKGTNCIKNINSKIYLTRTGNTLGKSSPKNIKKKFLYQEESDSGPEIEENQYVPEEDEDTEEKKRRSKENSQKRKMKILDYLNKDAKINKQ